MKHFFILYLLLCSVFIDSKAQQKPHIIIYLADDLSWTDVGFNGAKVVKTPNLDAFAQQGMVFDNAFIASPACAPSRAALLTGLMPARNGAENNHTYPKPGIGVLISSCRKTGTRYMLLGKLLTVIWVKIVISIFTINNL